MSLNTYHRVWWTSVRGLKCCLIKKYDFEILSARLGSEGSEWCQIHSISPISLDLVHSVVQNDPCNIIYQNQSEVLLSSMVSSLRDPHWCSGTYLKPLPWYPTSQLFQLWVSSCGSKLPKDNCPLRHLRTTKMSFFPLSPNLVL